MPKEHEYGWNIEDLSDAEIAAVIHYLDPTPTDEKLRKADITVRTLCVAFIALMFVAVVFLWFYLRNP